MKNLIKKIISTLYTSCQYIIRKLFHECEFKTIDIPYSNIVGEMWIQQCKCGKKREVIFSYSKKYGNKILIKDIN